MGFRLPLRSDSCSAKGRLRGSRREAAALSDFGPDGTLERSTERQDHVCPFALGLRRSSPHHSSTISNEAAFGTDYFTRTAVAKSNIFVNAPIETKYFYQDLDASGARLRPARGSMAHAATR